jgi:hypothetical protein
MAMNIIHQGVGVAGGVAPCRMGPNSFLYTSSQHTTVFERASAMDLTNDLALTIALLVAWLCLLVSADEFTLNVLIPMMYGSLDWINYFLR